MSNFYLVADVGATKTELAVYSGKDDIRKFYLKERFATVEYESLEKLIGNFLQKNNLEITNAVCAIAGPIINDRVTKSSSNLPWEVSKLSLSEKLNIPEIELINDLVAVAYAIPHLIDEDLNTINKGVKTNTEPLAVIAPGTGLGEAFLIWDGKRYRPCISEGSHVNFGPRTEEEIGLLKHLMKTHTHVTYESVCSGLGIPSIYEYLKDRSEPEETSGISGPMDTDENISRSIIEAAVQKEGTSRIANDVLKLFVSVLGAETGNLVLKTMALGGVYLAGGIPPRITTFLDSEFFLDAYSDKGLMTEIMLDVPIHIITNPNAGIMGAARYLFNYDKPI